MNPFCKIFLIISCLTCFDLGAQRPTAPPPQQKHDVPKALGDTSNHHLRIRGVGFEFNALQIFRLFGFEGELVATPARWMDIKFGGVAYGNLGLFHDLLGFPLRRNQGLIGEMRFRLPGNSLKPRGYAGVFYQFRAGSYTYDGVINYVAYQDVYAFRQNNVGLTLGFCYRTLRNFYFDFFGGLGYSVRNVFQREPGFNPLAPDMSQDLRFTTNYIIRAGFCLGAYFGE